MKYYKFNMPAEPITTRMFNLHQILGTRQRGHPGITSYRKSSQFTDPHSDGPSRAYRFSINTGKHKPIIEPPQRLRK